MRFRERNNISPMVINRTVNQKANQHSPTHICKVTTTTAATVAYPVGTYASITDETVPNFKTRTAKGEVFNNPMSSIEYSRTMTAAPYHVYYPYKTSGDPIPAIDRHCPYASEEDANCVKLVVDYCASSPVGHLGSDLSSRRMIEIAGTQAYANIDNPLFEGAVFIAELRETISFLRSPLKSLNKGLREIRRVKRANKIYVDTPLGHFIRDNWLAYRYALRPLVKDVHDAAEAVAETVLNRKPVRKTARGVCSTSENFDASGVLPTDSRFAWSARTQKSCNVRAGVLYEYSRSPDTFGIAWTKVPVAFWEGIPYSFLVDRFLNVGSFIEAISPVAGVRHLAAWTTVIENANTHRSTWWNSIPDDVAGRIGVIVNDGKVEEEYTSKTKTRSPGVKIGLTSRLAPLQRDGELDKSFVLDLVAIGAQLLSNP